MNTDLNTKMTFSDALLQGNNLLLIYGQIADAKSDVLTYTEALSSIEDDGKERDVVMGLINAANEGVCNAYDICARFILEKLVDRDMTCSLIGKEIVQLVEPDSPYHERIVGNPKYAALMEVYQQLTED